MDIYDNDVENKTEVGVYKRSDSFEIEKPLFSDNESEGLRKDGISHPTPSKIGYESHYLTLNQVGFCTGLHSSFASR